MPAQRWLYVMLVLLSVVLTALAQGVGADTTRVSTARLDAIAIYPQQSAPATVHSLNETAISTEIAARITSIPVRVGEVVERGALLATLDCADYRLRHAEAEAGIAALDARIGLAERRLRRTEQLIQQQSVAEQRLDEQRADLAVLRADKRAGAAALAMAAADIARCRLTSPFPAVIVRRLGAEGEFAARGTPVLEIMDSAELEVAAEAPLGDTARIEAADALFFEDSAKRYPLALRAATPAVNTATRNRELRLVFTETRALPGTAGKLTWRDKRPHLPGKLLVRRGDVLGVFTAEGGTARFHALAGAQQGRATAVALPPDSRVITEGQYGLADGQAIIVVP